MTWCESWRSSRHFKCLLLSLGIWAVFVMDWICYFNVCSLQCSYVYNLASPWSACNSFPPYPTGLIVLGCLYFVYMIESMACNTRKYLSELQSVEKAFNKFMRARSLSPSISWRAVCWHTELRTRTVTDSNGNSRTETYYERVNTHSAN